MPLLLCRHLPAAACPHCPPQVAVGILTRCQVQLLEMDDFEQMVELLRQEVPRWPRVVLQELLTEALSQPWSPRQLRVLEQINGAETVIEAVQRVQSLQAATPTEEAECGEAQGGLSSATGSRSARCRSMTLNLTAEAPGAVGKATAAVTVAVAPAHGDAPGGQQHQPLTPRAAAVSKVLRFKPLPSPGSSADLLSWGEGDAAPAGQQQQPPTPRAAAASKVLRLKPLPSPSSRADLLAWGEATQQLQSLPSCKLRIETEIGGNVELVESLSLALSSYQGLSTNSLASRPLATATAGSQASAAAAPVGMAPLPPSKSVLAGQAAEPATAPAAAAAAAITAAPAVAAAPPDAGLGRSVVICHAVKSPLPSPFGGQQPAATAAAAAQTTAAPAAAGLCCSIVFEAGKPPLPSPFGGQQPAAAAPTVAAPAAGLCRSIVICHAGKSPLPSPFSGQQPAAAAPTAAGLCRSVVFDAGKPPLPSPFGGQQPAAAAPTAAAPTAGLCRGIVFDTGKPPLPSPFGGLEAANWVPVTPPPGQHAVPWAGAGGNGSQSLESQTSSTMALLRPAEQLPAAQAAAAAAAAAASAAAAAAAAAGGSSHFPGWSLRSLFKRASPAPSNRSNPATPAASEVPDSRQSSASACQPEGLPLGADIACVSSTQQQSSGLESFGSWKTGTTQHDTPCGPAPSQDLGSADRSGGRPRQRPKLGCPTPRRLTLADADSRMAQLRGLP